MPPPNTPEEFFEEEYQQRRNSAVANAASINRRRRFNLPPHDEDLAESEAEIELNSHPNTSQSESRRNSAERRMSIDQSLSRNSSRSYSPNQARRRNRGQVLRSASPSTVGPYQSDYEADYTNYLRQPATLEDRHESGLQSSTPSRSGGAPTVDDGHNLSFPDQPQPIDQGARQPMEPVDGQTNIEGLVAGELPLAVAPSPALPESGAAQPSQTLVIRQHRRHPKTPKFDWHALEYVGTYDENLDCPICRSPLVQPEITTCFHIFCHNCLAQSLRHGNRCPIDRNPIQFFRTSRGRVPARPAPHIISNQLDNLQVRCPNSRCDFTSARSLIGHHYKSECSFTKIPCPDLSCNKLVTRRDSEEGSCLHKAVDCVYCGKPVELAALDDHYDTDCNQKELMCEHCLAAVPRHRHGTHMTDCAERRIECKFRTSGCSYTSKKKDFGDHEHICLYGMVMRMNRAHRADMNSMETVLQDSQDRVRKLEADMAARPATNQQFAAPLPAPPPAPLTVPGGGMPTSGHAHLYEYSHPEPHPHTALDHHDLSNYYDATAAGDAQAHANGGGGTRPGTPPGGGGGSLMRHASDDDDRMNRIVAYIDIFDAKVENLERYLGEVDARQAQMFMNELGPLKDQILELRNSMGHISMYVRWLMESFRQTTKRSVGLRGGGAATGSGVGGVGGTGGDDDSVSGGRAAPSLSTPAGAASAAAAATAAGQRGPPTVLRGPAAGMAMPARRMSDRENPPRL